MEEISDAGGRDPGRLGDGFDRDAVFDDLVTPCERLADGADQVLLRDRGAIGGVGQVEIAAIGRDQHAAAVVAFESDVQRERDAAAFLAFFDRRRIEALGSSGL